MIAVVCMKWGSAFDPEYVNVLYRGVTRTLSEPFRFYCFTDDASGLADGIVARPIPDMALPAKRIRKGCWPKLGLFQPGLIAEETALFIDLDVVISGSLDSFVGRARELGGLHIIREWNPGLWNLLPLGARPDRGGQSSVVCWRPAEQGGIHTRFMADQTAAFAAAKNDQQYITIAATNLQYWPYDWTSSFKRAHVLYYPLSLLFPRIREPKGSQIVVFHGRPRPHELVGGDTAAWGTRRRRGFGEVAWVRDYWRAGPGRNRGARPGEPAVEPDAATVPAAVRTRVSGMH